MIHPNWQRLTILVLDLVLVAIVVSMFASLTREWAALWGIVGEYKSVLQEAAVSPQEAESLRGRLSTLEVGISSPSQFMLKGVIMLLGALAIGFLDYLITRNTSSRPHPRGRSEGEIRP